MMRCAYVFTTVYGHDTCLRVCVGWGGGGGMRACLASVSGPICMFVFVIRVAARRVFLPLRTKIKSWCLEVYTNKECITECVTN